MEFGIKSNQRKGNTMFAKVTFTKDGKVTAVPSKQPIMVKTIKGVELSLKGIGKPWTLSVKKT